MCDLEAMFHQFKVPEEDRDFLRLYWWENGDISKCPIEYHMTVHLFGAASSPGCANFGLKRAGNPFDLLASYKYERGKVMVQLTF